MKLFIRTQNESLSDELGTHIRRSVRFALSRDQRRIIRTHVHLSTVPRDATDPTCEEDEFECVVRIDLHTGSVVAREMGESAFLAVSQAVERIGQVVARTVDTTFTTSRDYAATTQRTAG